MTKRAYDNQNKHDTVVKTSADTWRRRPELLVYTNPDAQQNFSVNNTAFPDVVVVDRNNTLKVVEEIETEDSVNQNEIPQWKEYADFGVLFNLIVPKNKFSEANRLTERLRNVRIQTYTITSRGEVLIS